MENNKKQTLDDAADDYCSKNHAINEDRAAWQDIEESFIAGAEWQEKQMYSEDEVENLLFKWSMYQVNIEFDIIGKYIHLIVNRK